MIDYVVNAGSHILGMTGNKYLAFGLYYLPGLLCLWGYILRTARDIKKDKKSREEPHGYAPTVTVGTLIGRAVVTILPVGNLLAAIFDVGPEVFGRFFEWLGKVFDQPLVPDGAGWEQQRRQKRAARP